MIASSDGKAIYQFYVNPLGTVWDQKIDPVTGKLDIGWDMNCEVKTRRYDNSWTVEMRIDKKSIDVYPDTTLDKKTRLTGVSQVERLNIRRKQQRNGESAFWMPDWGYDINGFGRIEANEVRVLLK
jgi:hypothetical protein